MIIRLNGLFLAFVITACGPIPGAFSFQSGVARGPIEDPRDAELERESRHHLEVARFYFKKKNWTAVRVRLQQIVAEYPGFTDIAEVYYLLGEVYSLTNEHDLAVELFSRVVEEFPDSEFAQKARERLQELTGDGNRPDDPEKSTSMRGG